MLPHLGRPSVPRSVRVCGSVLRAGSLLFAYQSPVDTPFVAHVPGNGSKLTLM